MNQPNTQAKTAIVFGGSRGIGAAIAQRLAADGANVALTYVSAPEKAAEVVAAIDQRGGAAIAITADSTNATELQAAVTQVVEHFGRLDIVVINAGILHINDIATFDIDTLDRMLSVNVRGVFIAIQAAIAHMGEGGRVVTIGSNSAVRSGYPGSSVYSITKGAVAVMVKSLAVDLAPRGITINNVQPGPIATDMTADHIDMLREMIPLKRVVTPEDVAGLVAYLASEESAYMTAPA